MPDAGDEAPASADTARPSGAGPAGDGTVNSQVMDAVTALNAMSAGQAPASAAAMLAMVSANTIGLSMYNAVARQQADATLNSAAIAAACARMIGTRAAGIADPAPPQAMVAVAEAQGLAAIAMLKIHAAQTDEGGSAAREALARLADEAVAPPEAYPPAPNGQHG